MSNSEFGNISFDLPKNQSNVIKVIGVGGGGSNAINHMFKQGIKGVDFIVCNTDSQALENSAVPNKIQLGLYLTEGLGAGSNPDIGHQSAIESIADIEKMLDQNTKMVFITAGMGGGTGTGAAPVIAQLAKERDILTVGIVTLPFLFEGKVRQDQARIGIEKLRKQVDSLIIINNNKLREVYGNLGFTAGFSKADEVLATASRGIAEVITHHYTQNIDLRDAKTVLSNSGTAIMGSAKAEGENRAKDAIMSALDSPLLNDNKITGSKNVLLLIVSGSNEITLDEIGEINDYIQNEAGNNANIIMGVGEDSSLGEAIAVTIIATGFGVEQQNGIVNSEPKKIIHALEGEQSNIYNLTKNNISAFDFSQGNINEIKEEEKKIPVFDSLDLTITDSEDFINMSDKIKNIDISFEIVSPKKELNIFFNSEIPIKNQVKPQSLFDFPVKESIKESNQNENEKFATELKPERINNIKVNEPITNVSEEVIKYSLEEYMEVENLLTGSKPTQSKNEEVSSEMNITMKESSATKFKEVKTLDKSPMEMTIVETLLLRAEERRRKLKEFNYKFNNSVSMIEEYEKEPAYKRLGIDISSKIPDNSNSRISVSTDSNNDLQFRSNNSFLHDNVD